MSLEHLIRVPMTSARQGTNRAHKIASWVLANADEINDAENIQITFNCAGGAVSVEVKNRRKVHTAQLPPLAELKPPGSP